MSVWQLNKSSSVLETLTFVSISLALSISIVSYALSSIFLGVFLVLSVFYAIKNRASFKIKFVLLLPITFYIYGAVSYFWSVDTDETLKAMGRMVPLLMVPLSFCWMPTIKLKQLDLVLNIITISNAILGLFFLITAAFRYFKTNRFTEFTYHNLVSNLDQSAIYVSLCFSLSFLYLLFKEKTKANFALLIYFFYYCCYLHPKQLFLLFY